MDLAFPFPHDAQGPRYKAQFVIEIVGPRTLPGDAGRAVMAPPWHDALGRPLVYGMAPRDQSWRPIGPTDPTAAYDSLALAWPFLTRQGNLTSRSAERLFHTAEQYAAKVQRRAMPLPPPPDVDNTVQTLESIRDSLDVGFGMVFVPRTGQISEKAVQDLLARFAIKKLADGSFGWTHPTWPDPLFHVQASEGTTLGIDRNHGGLEILFSVPRCPAPIWALKECFRLAGSAAHEVGGWVVDDSGQLIDKDRERQLLGALSQVVENLKQVGLPAGSPEARMVFFG